MAKFPKALCEDLRAEPSSVDVAMLDKHGREIARLSPLEAEIWKLADGKTSALDMIKRRLADGFDVHDEEIVWQALDHLADLRLLEGRAGPPGPAPALLRRAILTSATVLGVASLAAVNAHAAALAAAISSATAICAAHQTPPEHAVGGVPRVEAVQTRHHHGHGHKTEGRVSENQRKSSLHPNSAPLSSK